MENTRISKKNLARLQFMLTNENIPFDSGTMDGGTHTVAYPNGEEPIFECLFFDDADVVRFVTFSQNTFAFCEVTVNEAFERIRRHYCGRKPAKTAVENDAVAHPSHYTYGKIECIDFIFDKSLDFALGNAIKYIVRAGHKPSDKMSATEKAIEDLKKAKQYIDFEIDYLRGVK